MGFSNFFKIDNWWKAVLIIGCLMSTASIMFNIQFLNPKHLFGLGLGMIAIGLSFFMAQKYLHVPDYGGYWTRKITQHNFISRVLLGIGIGFSAIFFVLLMLDLIK